MFSIKNIYTLKKFILSFEQKNSILKKITLGKKSKKNYDNNKQNIFDTNFYISST